MALQEASEAYLVGLFEDTNLCVSIPISIDRSWVNFLRQLLVAGYPRQEGDHHAQGHPVGQEDQGWKGLSFKWKVHVGSSSLINSKCTLSPCSTYPTLLLSYRSLIWCLGEVETFYTVLVSSALNPRLGTWWKRTLVNFSHPLCKINCHKVSDHAYIYTCRPVLLTAFVPLTVMISCNIECELCLQAKSSSEIALGLIFRDKVVEHFHFLYKFLEQS